MYLQDREAEAIVYFQDSVLSIWEHCSGVGEVERANTIYNIGICYQYQNDLPQAKAFLDRALVIFEQSPSYPRSELAEKYFGIGNFYHDNFDVFRAELYYEAALKIFRELGGSELDRFDVLNELLAMSSHFNQFDEAQAYFDEALAIHDTHPEVFEAEDLFPIYQNMGVVYFEQKAYPAAIEMGNMALKLVDKVDHPTEYALVVEMLAAIKLEQTDYGEAITSFKEVLDIRKKNDDSFNQSGHLILAYENLADAYIRQKDSKQAEQTLLQALRLLLLKGDFDGRGLPIIRTAVPRDQRSFIRLLGLKAQSAQLHFEETRDIQYLEEGLHLQFKIDSVVNRFLLALDSKSSRLEIFDLMIEHYETAIASALRLYHLTKESEYLEKAYHFSSKTKGIILQYEMNESTALHTLLDSTLVQKERALRRALYAAHPDPYLEGAIRDSLILVYLKAQTDLDQFLATLEQLEPLYFEQKYAYRQTASIRALRNQLPSQLSLVEYFYGKDSVYSFWISDSDFFYQSVAKEALWVNNDLEQYISQCHTPQSILEPTISNRLYGKLVQQGVEQLGEGITRLCIIPDGLLHQMSFDALVTDLSSNSYLLEKYALSYAYSNTLIREDMRAANTTPYVGFGTRYSPELTDKLRTQKLLFGEESLGPLVLAAEEVRRGEEIFGGEIFLEREATVSHFYQHTTATDVIHLSLHGLVDMDDPARSCIIFDDQASNYLLTPTSLYSHRMQAQLVMLSACHTASGKIYRGEGVRGMSKAFLLSGAGSVLSSLWSASEGSSLSIMSKFLHWVKNGEPKDIALQNAKLAFLRQAGPSQRAPYYWANYSLIGDATPLQTKGTNWWFFPLLLLGSLLLLIFFFRLKLLKNR